MAHRGMDDVLPRSGAAAARPSGRVLTAPSARGVYPSTVPRLLDGLAAGGWTPPEECQGIGVL